VTSDPPPGVRRLAPRSFRSKIVLSTVGLMMVAMVLMGLGIQLLLARTAQNDINTVLNDRANAVIRVISQASKDRLTVPPDALEPGMEVFDGDGREEGPRCRRGAGHLGDPAHPQRPAGRGEAAQRPLHHAQR
jgi:hypothetical protein